MVHAEGDSMEAEIFHGDLLVVNRNLQPQPGDKVVACVGASYTVKIYSPCKNGLRLVASNEKYATRIVQDNSARGVSSVLNTDCLTSIF